MQLLQRSKSNDLSTQFIQFVLNINLDRLQRLRNVCKKQILTLLTENPFFVLCYNLQPVQLFFIAKETLTFIILLNCATYHQS